MPVNNDNGNEPNLKDGEFICDRCGRVSAPWQDSDYGDETECRDCVIGAAGDYITASIERIGAVCGSEQPKPYTGDDDDMTLEGM